MYYGYCCYCDSAVYESDERINHRFGVAHFECHERNESELEAEKLQNIRDERLRSKIENKLVTRLRRTLKPKLWAAISMVLRDHAVHGIQIDSFNKVTGNKVKGRDWFGESVAIRHVFDDTSSCSYSDTYGGLLWLPIGMGRYLQIHISG